jgi:uncharacterized protein YcsI (UPF0317 family)
MTFINKYVEKGWTFTLRAEDVLNPDHGFKASIENGRNPIWGCGTTPAEAVADLDELLSALGGRRD